MWKTGQTYSSSFPVTPGAYQTTLGGESDAFVSKFSALGTVLWSTYLGGSIGAPTDLEAGVDIVVDDTGSVTVAGYTDEINFPTNGGFQAIYGGGPTDAFVSRFLPDGSALEWSSLLGGDNADQATGVARDSSGVTYPAGFTGSSNFPVTAGGWGPSFSQDGFLVQVASGDTTPPNTAITACDSYEVDFDGTPVSVLGNTFALSSSPEGNHTWRVRAVDLAGNVSGWSALWSFTLDNIPPGQVQLLTPANGSLLSTGGETFSWEELFDQNDIAYYVLQLDENATFPNPVFLEATSANLFLPIPPPGSALLYWRVRAVDTPGNLGAWSQTWSYSGTNSLDTPTLLLPINGSLLPEEGFVLDWSDVPDAAGYEIEIDPGFTGSPVVSQQESPLLSPGTYSWRVRAVNPGSTGPWSSWSSFTMDPTMVFDTTGPFSPANGTIDIVDPVVELKWFAGNDPESGIAYHRVELFDSTGLFLLHEEVVEETYLVLPPLEAGTYSWTVTAINGAGAGSIPSATWTFSVEPTLDTNPPGASILFYPPNESVIESDVIAFLWNEAPDDVRVVGYEIEINKQPTFENPVAWRIHTNEPKVTIRLPTRLHYWRVRPIDGGGNKGPWSETWSFEVRHPPVSAGPGEAFRIVTDSRFPPDQREGRRESLDLLKWRRDRPRGIRSSGSRPGQTPGTNRPHRQKRRR